MSPQLLAEFMPIRVSATPFAVSPVPHTMTPTTATARPASVMASLARLGLRAVIDMVSRRSHVQPLVVGNAGRRATVAGLGAALVALQPAGFLNGVAG